MTLKSALQDVKETTLGAVSGLLASLLIWDRYGAPTAAMSTGV